VVKTISLSERETKRLLGEGVGESMRQRVRREKRELGVRER
jgi:hypothetical protein